MNILHGIQYNKKCGLTDQQWFAARCLQGAGGGDRGTAGVPGSVLAGLDHLSRACCTGLVRLLCFPGCVQRDCRCLADDNYSFST